MTIVIAHSAFCSFSNITFRSIVDELNTELQGLPTGSETVYVVFTDGNLAPISQDILAHLAGQARLFVVSLLDDMTGASPRRVTRADIVVSKRVQPGVLKALMAERLTRRLKKSSLPKKMRGTLMETMVLMMLLGGYTPRQVSGKLNLAEKTVSRYRMMAVRRSGFRNFNELVINHLRYGEFRGWPDYEGGRNAG